MKPRIGLFTGGIETYWKDTGMQELPKLLQEDSLRLIQKLSEDFDVVYPGVAGNAEQSTQRAREIRDAGIEAVVMYHATYVDDAMMNSIVRSLCTTR